jgi:pyruvate dehydrogenase complex dehydrogenase (E1) component
MSHGWKFWVLITLAVVAGVIDAILQSFNDYLNNKGL